MLGRFRTFRRSFIIVFLYIFKELISRRERRFILTIGIFNFFIDKLYIIYTFIVSSTILISAFILIKTFLLRQNIIRGLIFYYIILVETLGSIILVVKILTSTFIFSSIVSFLGRQQLSKLLKAVLIIIVTRIILIIGIYLTISRTVRIQLRLRLFISIIKYRPKRRPILGTLR